jgi:hypothetical protein
MVEALSKTENPNYSAIAEEKILSTKATQKYDKTISFLSPYLLHYFVK